MTGTARSPQMDPVTSTAYSRQGTLRNRYSRWRNERTQRNAVPIPDYNERNSRSYGRRIETLFGYASEEGIIARDESVKDFSFFVDAVIPTDKAMLAITDDGHLRATWRKQHSRLSLEFIGGRIVHYVVLTVTDSTEKMCEDSGKCSFDEILAHIKDWELWDMVAP